SPGGNATTTDTVRKSLPAERSTGRRTRRPSPSTTGTTTVPGRCGKRWPPGRRPSFRRRRMLETIWNGIKRVAGFLTGEDNQVVVADEPEGLASGIPYEGLSTLSAASGEIESAVDLSRWTVIEHVESPFE